MTNADLISPSALDQLRALADTLAAYCLQTVNDDYDAGKSDAYADAAEQLRAVLGRMKEAP